MPALSRAIPFARPAWVSMTDAPPPDRRNGGKRERVDILPEGRARRRPRPHSRGKCHMSQELQSQSDQSDPVERLYVKPSPTSDALVLTRHGAMRSRHWRFWLGLFELTTGVLTCLVTVVNATTGIGHLQDMAASGVQPPAEWIAYVLAVIGAFGLVSIGGVVIGIWNLATIKSSARSPLIAAIVVSTASIVLTMVFIGGDLFDPVKIVWTSLHAVVGLWTIGVLRLKKVTAS